MAHSGFLRSFTAFIKKEFLHIFRDIRMIFPLNVSFEDVEAKVAKPFVIFSANAQNLPLKEYLDYAKKF